MPQFENHGLKGGVWKGWLSTPPQPDMRVFLAHQDHVLCQGRLFAAQDGTQIEVEIPGSVLSDGLQTLLLISDSGEGTDKRVLGRLQLLAGKPLAEDMVSEISALRAELELVKRELRRLGSHRSAG